jgi:hypothetical protein
MQVAVLDPLVKVFRDDPPTSGSQSATAADAARGEHASFQLVVTAGTVDMTDLQCTATSFARTIAPAGEKPLPQPTTRFVGYVGSSLSADKPASDQLRPAPAIYPDPLLPKQKTDVHAGDNQPIWLTQLIPLDATPGDYLATATLTARVLGIPTSATLPLRLHVYPATIKDTRLNVTLWYQMWNHSGRKMPERYSDAWFDIIRIYAQSMKEHRQNWGWVETQEALTFSRDAAGKLQVDFTNFDKWVSLWLDAGFRKIEGQHFAFRSGDWKSDFAVQVWKPGSGGKWSATKVAPDAAEAQQFYSEYFPQFQAHLASRGWLDKYVQHVADEPIDSNADSYTTAAQLLRRYAPKLKIMDACQSQKVTGMVDVWIPQLDHFAKGYDFFKKRQTAGDDVWFYTCMYPSGEYANRFLELPLIKTRLLHWINFRYGATGYLHWGYNYWPPHVWQDTADYRMARLPGGDANIVYPDPDSFAVFDSIRYEAMRDGIEDHELLSQLAEKNPAAADSLARRVIIDFTNYDTDVPRFRQTRKELLEALSD